MTKKTSRSASSSGSRKTTRAKSGSSTPKSKSGSNTKTRAKGTSTKSSGAAKTTRSTAKAAKPPARTTRSAKKLGRSRIPVDAPLEVIFEHDQEARAAFSYLGIETIRELQKFGPDELIMRLTSPTKLTVGRIRKMLAANNRCLDGDERFALDAQKQKQ